MEDLQAFREIEEAASYLMKLKHEELDNESATVLQDLIESTESRINFEREDALPRRMFPAACPFPRPQIKRQKFGNGNRSIANENRNVFEPNPEFIRKLTRGDISLTKLPLLGQSIDKRDFPMLPPIASLQGIIGNCSTPFEKQLTMSDLARNQGRLAFAKEAVNSKLKEIMTEQEYASASSKEGIEVTVYDRTGKGWEMKFALWGVKMFVLKTGWNDFCAHHGLEMHLDWVTIWMFRHRVTEKLCFALLVRKFPTENLIGKKRKRCGQKQEAENGGE